MQCEIEAAMNEARGEILTAILRRMREICHESSPDPVQVQHGPTFDIRRWFPLSRSNEDRDLLWSALRELEQDAVIVRTRLPENEHLALTPRGLAQAKRIEVRRG